MAKFCTKCGEELTQGEKHICSAVKNKNEEKESSKVIQSDIDFKEGFTNCLNYLKVLLSKPKEAIDDFVTEKKYFSGILLIFLTAIASGLYRIATLHVAYGANSSKGFSGTELVDLFKISFTKEPDYLKEFMTKFATSLAQYALIAILGYFIIKSLLKGKATIKEMFTSVGASLGIVFISFVINAVLVFIDAEVVGYIRTYITSFASIFSILVLYQSVKKVSNINKETLFLATASMSVSATIVIDLINKLFD